ncbi:MAG: glucosyltransferase domain-containing protein [Lachnospiraceae bacterium]|nr:glucosyltransferase domain-containing protein [Lachnospiraceae bacterium]
MNKKQTMKKQFQNLAMPFQAFVLYIKEHLLLGMMLFALLLLVYGKAAYSNDFYVDAEVILNHPRTFYNWGGIGRFGLIAVKCLTGMHWYNPYFAAALFLITMWLEGMCCCLLFSRLGYGGSDSVNLVFTCLFLIFPTLADQYMFRFQSFEIVLGMTMIVVSSGYFLLFLKKKNPAAFALAVLLDIGSYGIYQSMVNLQICFYIVLYLFCMERVTAAERKKQVLWSMLHFIVGFAVYEIIATLFFNDTTYLADQVGWFSGDLAWTIRNLLAYVKHVLLATDVFYPVTYVVCVAAGAAALIFYVCKKIYRVPAILGICAVLASPFFLAIVTGSPTIYRAQCMLPFVCASMWLFLVHFLSEYLPGKKIFRHLWILCGCILLFMQASVVMRMFYTQDVIRDADRITAQQMMNRLDALSDTARTKPVVFTGHLDAKGNGSCYTKEEAASFLAYSLFEYAYVEGVPIETPNYYNTGRILGYFETLGFSYEMPTKEETAEAEIISAGMDCWPASSSVAETETFVVIKLSDF